MPSTIPGLPAPSGTFLLAPMPSIAPELGPASSLELPAPPEKAAEFMSKSVIIALAGTDREDLRKAKVAEIPRQDYVDAARFLTAHGMAYDGMSCNEDRARELFAPNGHVLNATKAGSESLNLRRARAVVCLIG